MIMARVGQFLAELGDSLLLHPQVRAERHHELEVLLQISKRKTTLLELIRAVVPRREGRTFTVRFGKGRGLS